MDYLYSLYDALVSINVPNDKARAVVDAMERDMGTTLATKSDLENLRIATKADLDNLRTATKADMENLRTSIKADLQLLRQEFISMISDLRKDIEILSAAMTVRLGSMLMLGLGLLFAALKLT